MKNNPKISIIMPVYNVETFLSEAIESVLNQTFYDFEFVIINDGSTDNSLEIIKNYEKKDSRIVLLDNKENLGITKSLNIGLNKARGEYIARMDGDDISEKERIEIQYDFLKKNRDVFLVGTETKRIDEKGTVFGIFKPVFTKNELMKNILENNLIYHPTIMMKNKKDLFYREKMYYVEDYDLYLRLISEGKKLDNISLPLLKYRIREDSICISKAGKQNLFAKKAREFYKERLKYGKDSYDKFDPMEILSIDIEKTTDKSFLEAEAEASFRSNNFKQLRKISRKYFRYYGFFNKTGFYYIISFAGICLVDLARKIRRLPRNIFYIFLYFL